MGTASSHQFSAISFSISSIFVRLLLISLVMVNLFKVTRAQAVFEDPCSKNPCQFGGKCHRIGTGSNYLCACSNGHWGQHCEFAAGQQPCSTNLCHSGSTCKPDAGQSEQYRCLCRRGFTGKFCNLTSVDIPAYRCENLCGERGTPVSQKRKRKGVCECQCHEEMYENERGKPKWCQKRLGCAPYNWSDPLTGQLIQRTPCDNGGKCEHDRVYGYTCKCSDYYAGKDCERANLGPGVIDPCRNNPCRNNAACRLVPQNRKQTKWDYKQPPEAMCLCPFGFKGRFCEIKVTPCDLTEVEEQCNDDSSDPACMNRTEKAAKCYNGGVCEIFGDLRNGSKGFRCRCDESPWTGEFCTVIDPCKQNRSYCSADSNCLTTASEDGTKLVPICVCQPGSAGKDCRQLDPNACDPKFKNPCAYGGICVKCSTNTNGTSNSPYCRTFEDFQRQFVCACPLRRTGPFCNETSLPCDVSRCKNGGVCVDTNLSNYECVCLEGYSGDHCEHIDDVCKARTPCRNGGICAIRGGDVLQFSCICPPGFYGISCQLKHYTFFGNYLNYYQHLAIWSFITGIIISILLIGLYYAGLSCAIETKQKQA